MKSIIQREEGACYICGRNGGYFGLDEHHIFGGANRKNSQKYGLTIKLCHDDCHLNGIHRDAELDRAIKAEAQRKAMNTYNWTVDEFIGIFGKNYL